MPYGAGVHYDSEEQRRPLLHQPVADQVLPLSYAIDAMQALVASDDTGEVWRNVGIVAAFALGALALGAATLRRRTA